MSIYLISFQSDMSIILLLTKKRNCITHKKGQKRLFCVVFNVSMYNVASPENRKMLQKYGKCFILKRTKQSKTV